MQFYHVTKYSLLTTIYYRHRMVSFTSILYFFAELYYSQGSISPNPFGNPIPIKTENISSSSSQKYPVCGVASCHTHGEPPFCCCETRHRGNARRRTSSTHAARGCCGKSTNISRTKQPIRAASLLLLYIYLVY